MKITKYEHACLAVEEDNKKLIIDPGIFSSSCTDFRSVSGVIVTHVHPDHFDPDKLSEICRQNPEAMIYTVQEVSDQLDKSMPSMVVGGGQQVACGPFQLDFYGGEHAIIHPSYPAAENIAVIVNKFLYYPGDSFTVPHQPFEVLAVPASAPWLKIQETMDFIMAIKPGRVFPTHNALLSDIGQNVNDAWLQKACETVGSTYFNLKSRESFTN